MVPKTLSLVAAQGPTGMDIFPGFGYSCCRRDRGGVYWPLPCNYYQRF